ncbi:MAG TPA: hypothetical protein VMZ11_02675 [Mycobacteriales bacterium]|nr:hypothetical protein [Mycobacteriales bacterium]
MPRPLARPLALASLTCLIALAGCSSSDDKERSAAPAGSGTPTATASASALPSGAAPTSSPTPAVSGPAASAGARPSVGASAAPQATTAPGRPAASKATAPGSYTYDSSGSQRTGAYRSPVTGSATLTVTWLSNGRQRSTLHNAQGDTVQDVLVRDRGSYLVDLQVKAPGLPDKEFGFSPAVLLLPDPARVGATWNWGGRSTDGKTTVATSNKVVRQETLTIGGRRVATVVLQTHLVLSGDIDYTADLTTWVAPSLRLPVKDHTVGKGRAYGVPFAFDVTDVMRSTTPA